MKKLDLLERYPIKRVTTSLNRLIGWVLLPDAVFFVFGVVLAVLGNHSVILDGSVSREVVIRGAVMMAVGFLLMIVTFLMAVSKVVMVVIFLEYLENKLNDSIEEGDGAIKVKKDAIKVGDDDSE